MKLPFASEVTITVLHSGYLVEVKPADEEGRTYGEAVKGLERRFGASRLHELVALLRRELEGEDAY